MKRQVPGGEPRIFPLVRHRHDVGQGDVLPPGVAGRRPPSLRRRRRLSRITVEPLFDIETVKLLAPRATRRRPGGQSCDPRASDRTGNHVPNRTRRPRPSGRANTRSKDGPNGCLTNCFGHQAKGYGDDSPGRHRVEVVPKATFVPCRPDSRRRVMPDDEAADPVLRVRGGGSGRLEQGFSRSGLVVAEQLPPGASLGGLAKPPGRRAPLLLSSSGIDEARVARCPRTGQGWIERLPFVPAPRPGVAQPELRDELQRRGIRPVVRRGDRSAGGRPGSALA